MISSHPLNGAPGLTVENHGDHYIVRRDATGFVIWQSRVCKSPHLELRKVADKIRQMEAMRNDKGK